MGDTVISLKCPNCGASVARDAAKCEYCGSPLIIKSYADIKPLSLPERNKYLAFFVGRMQSDGAVSSSLSTAICLMSLGVYDKARRRRGLCARSSLCSEQKRQSDFKSKKLPWANHGSFLYTSARFYRKQYRQNSL